MTRLKLFKPNTIINRDEKLQKTTKDALLAASLLESCYKYTSKNGIRNTWFKQYMNQISKLRTDLSGFEAFKTDEQVKIYITKLNTLIGLSYEIKDKICDNPFIDPAKSTINNLKEILTSISKKINQETGVSNNNEATMSLQ
ncbi:hypothetical protein [Legionella clemsonensis]|uniref:Uncharacterized protein n=1 Tax=Legionella clemsonensis TaxID=1867846 RepID=A0A222P3W3_9GAMM|nr:hypothetical protein [Legionella clemsonensis]ASQ46523.1 hypothetical protein clem_09870 [Legionella clemsonensis]